LILDFGFWIRKSITLITLSVFKIEKKGILKVDSSRRSE
jgi:hypothetical protein